MPSPANSPAAVLGGYGDGWQGEGARRLGEVVGWLVDGLADVGGALGDGDVVDRGGRAAIEDGHGGAGRYFPGEGGYGFMASWGG